MPRHQSGTASEDGEKTAQNWTPHHPSHPPPPPGKSPDPMVNHRLPIPIIFDAPPSSSIPGDIDTVEYARQCKHAAQSSRLDPFVLHPSEYCLVKESLPPEHVTTYLNIRNSILRLWIRSPMVAVTLNEAVGCVRHSRFIPLAQVAYEWLVRNGYINFGCVTVPETSLPPSLMPAQTWRPRVVIVGAGIAGIGCARQLDALFHHFEHELLIRGMLRPDIVILEARNRIGGRMYSIPLSNRLDDGRHPSVSPGAVEMGAQIVTGFERGNPLNQIILGQLGLHVHMMENMNDLVLYDIDGSPDRLQDLRVDKLFNDILDRASSFKAHSARPPTVAGDEDLINSGKDPEVESADSLASLEKRGKLSFFPWAPPAGPDGSKGGAAAAPPAAWAARYMGWPLRSRVALKTDINLGPSSKGMNVSLGSVVEDAVHQYQKIIPMNPRDLRVFNWHCANLEYSSAAPLTELSLSGWDQDSGNEFEGDHANVIGGYGQVPWALSKCPSKLDIRLQHPVKSICQKENSQLGFPSAMIESSNGSSIRAEIVVLSVPLGVLKEQSIVFDPPLPNEKVACIQRLGFGLLNKVILVFPYKFWDVKKDAFGMLQPPENGLLTSMDMRDYAPGRGSFHIFWDCSVASTRPTLVAMMAGISAEITEQATNEDLISRALEELGRVFGRPNVPDPVEAFITRWRRDPFARGSYSFISKHSEATDHDQLASPARPFLFAGEATCGTHPATVHGAYLSGLRAASEVLDSLIGPIQPLKAPLLPVPAVLSAVPAARSGGRKRGNTSNSGRSTAKRRAEDKSPSQSKVGPKSPSSQRPARRRQSRLFLPVQDGSSMKGLSSVPTPTSSPLLSSPDLKASDTPNQDPSTRGDISIPFGTSSSASSTPAASDLYISATSTPTLGPVCSAGGEDAKHNSLTRVTDSPV